MSLQVKNFIKFWDCLSLDLIWGWGSGGTVFSTDSVHGHPSKPNSLYAFHATYSTHLSRSLCLNDVLCQSPFSGFFTTNSGLWILTVWSLLPHRQRPRTPYRHSPALCLKLRFGLKTLAGQQVKENFPFQCRLLKKTSWWKILTSRP